MKTTGISRLSGFLGDRRGSVAMTVGLSFVPALLVAGAAIDYSRATTQWSNLQQAVDATALVTAHTYLTQTSSNASLKTFAQSYISGMMNGATVDTVSTAQNNSQVCVTSGFDVPTAFMKIANIRNVHVGANACSQVGQTYEVALALDNSGSMQDSANGTSKIQSLKTAAKKLVNILIPAGTTSPQVAISMVPFNSLVNVGTSRTAAFLDTAGASSIHWQNLHRPSTAAFKPTTKFDLFDAMSGAPWGGCVEEPPPPATTSDLDPTAAADNKFVPYFAPDEPGDVDDPSKGYVCYQNGGGGSANCGKSIPPYININSYLADPTGSATKIGTCNASNSAADQSYTTADTATTYSGDNQTNVYPGSGATMICKYKGTSPTKLTVLGSQINAVTGPNLLCNSQQVTPLTTNEATLTKTTTGAIDSMVAQGSTDLATGFMWAWRSISPKVKPFPTTSTAAVGPQNPKSYTIASPANQKVIVLMTDGQNSWFPNPYNQWGSVYESFGYFANNRISSYLSSNSAVPGSTSCGGTSLNYNNANCALDNVFLEGCKNAKAAGILVYTIGVSAKAGDVDDALLKSCATSPSDSHYFPVSDDASMSSAFQQIAASILSLRLSQ